MKVRYASLMLGSLLCLGTNSYAQVYTFGTLAGNPAIVDENGYPVGDFVDGSDADARFNFPQAVTVDSAGTVFVADTVNNAVRALRREAGHWVVTTVAGSGPMSAGSDDGTNGQARFTVPQGLAADAAGNVYVADTFNYTIRRIAPVGNDWVVTTIAGVAGASGTNDGPGGTAQFSTPVSLAVDAATNVYVADYTANTIRKLVPVGTNWVVSTIAGACQQTGSKDGMNNQARFNGPGSIVADSAGRLYVGDWNNGTIRKITLVDTNYVVTTIAGEPNHSGWQDGTGSKARFTIPLGGIGLEPSGNLYVTDAGMVRKITPVGNNWVVTTIAGAYDEAGWADGSGSSVRFYWPQAVAADSVGNLYVADSNNHAIRLGTPSSVVSPPLEIVRNESDLILSWPLSAPAFVLEAGSAVGARVTWTVIDEGVYISGGRFLFTNTITANSAFYRLRLPQP